MMDWRNIAQRALRGAVDVRQRLRVERSRPLCIIDAAADLGLRVQFVDLGAFEGLYGRQCGTVMLNIARPFGRRSYTCAHEVGHWYFRHGDRIDGLDFDRDDPEKPDERLVNHFAAFLLMPRRAIETAFLKRNVRIETSDPVAVYSVATYLGVGYETLVNHLCYGIRVISATRANELNSLSPKKIKEQILGYTFTAHLVIVPETWEHVPIDLEVGDLAVCPAGTSAEGTSIELIGHCQMGDIVCARRAGVGRVTLSSKSWSAFVRVSRRGFTGWARYRHFPDPDSTE